jgi:mono/diheme cytochrome c family protein
MPGDPDAGAAVYASTCVACHAANGQGNGGMTGADFVNDESRLAKDNAVLIRSITDGVLTASPPMPGHGTILTETQIRDVLSYIRREFGQN